VAAEQIEEKKLREKKLKNWREVPATAANRSFSSALAFMYALLVCE